MSQASYAVTLESIYAAAVEPDRWPEALTATADFVGGIGAMLASHDLKRAEGSLIVGRLSEDDSALYLREYVRNPYSLAAQSSPGAAVAGSAIADTAAVRRTAFHADMLAPQRIADFAIVCHESLTDTDHVGGISVALAARRAEEPLAAVRRLGRLTPHLSRAIDLSLATQAQGAEARRAEVLIDALPGAALLLSADGAVLRANTQGEALLRAEDGLCTGAGDGPGRLAAALDAETRRLQRLVARAAASAAGGEDGFEPVMRVTRPSGRTSYVVVATPLPPGPFARLQSATRGARVLLQVIDPEARRRASPRMLAEAFDLTPAEARVAALVGSGLSIPHAATALGLTANTVRTHVSRCFDKTGVRSQAELAGLAASLPKTPHPIG